MEKGGQVKKIKQEAPDAGARGAEASVAAVREAVGGAVGVLEGCGQQSRPSAA